MSADMGREGMGSMLWGYTHTTAHMPHIPHVYNHSLTDGYSRYSKLFIGGLSWETTIEKLTEYFCRYGEVTDCVVMKNAETGRSRGFGFVTFKDPSCVQIVMASGPHILDGRTIDPKECNPKSAQKGKRDAKVGNFPKVFLGGLPPNVNESTLRDYFSKFGKVVEVVIMYDQEKKKTRGFGFLSFDNEDTIDKVVQEHFVTIGGKQVMSNTSVEIKRAEPRDKASGKPMGNLMGGSPMQPHGGGHPMAGAMPPWNPMTVFVRGPENSNIEHFVEKVVFHLHESFPKPKRVLKEPPYQVQESGYASFELPIEVYFKNKEEPKKISFDYDLYLRLDDAVSHSRREKLTFQNPSNDFKKKLLKAGGN
ncbi:unnamed protein product [Oppiella nova]|uniref:Uncharacterized protein n=2 Tax=Oppiella nova TaxID=334625 RepID=A0A7R9LN88_9ACAR|nr:unnamed protein product [Oppiella nova]CAG2164715.1 unnamed protein product [Oppiella nova]